MKYLKKSTNLNLKARLMLVLTAHLFFVYSACADDNRLQKKYIDPITYGNEE